MHKEPSWQDVPLFRIRAARDTLFLIGVVAVTYLAWALRVVAVPCLLSLSAAFILDPVVKLANQRWGVPRFIVSSALLFVLTVGVALVITFGVPPLVQDMESLANELPEQLASAGVPSEPIEQGLAPVQSPEDLFQLALRHFRETSAWLLGAIGAFGFLTIVLVFTGIMFVYFSSKLHHVKVVERYLREENIQLVYKMLHIFAGYLRGQFLVALWTVFGFALGFSIAGVPYALVAAAVGGTLSFIPNGQMAGWVLALLFGLLEKLSGDGSGWIEITLYPSLVYLVTQSAETFIITPIVQGSSVKLHPLVVLAALVAGANLGGILGLFLAIPFAACFRVFAQERILPALKRRAAMTAVSSHQER